MCANYVRLYYIFDCCKTSIFFWGMGKKIWAVARTAVVLFYY